MEADIVIATYSFDRLDYLRDGIEGIAQGTCKPRQTIVSVDSNPELGVALRAEMPDWVTIIDSDGRGASAARNSAFAVAGSEIVACLDDDARPDARWLEALVESFADPAVVCVGGHIVPRYEDGATPIPPELLWLVGCTYRGHRDTPGPITRPIGANMAFRRRAMLEVGGFDTDFGPDGEVRTSSNEEIVLSLELRKRFGDGCIRYAPEATVFHTVPAARSTWRYLVRRCRVEGTSKASVRKLGGPAVMGDDNRYLTRVLIPGIGSHLVHGRPSAAARCTLAAAVTGTSYLARRATDR